MDQWQFWNKMICLKINLDLNEFLFEVISKIFPLFSQSYFEEGSLKISSSWDDVSKRHLESLEPIIHNFERPGNEF